MARVYANLLYANKRTWDTVPNNLKTDVLSILKADVVQGIITPERFENITGETYAE